MQKNKKILVWLSGWVDSAVAAYLLKKEWYDVTAGFMINYLAPEGEVCPTREDIEVAKEVANYLEIPFFTFDYRDEYEEKVLNYMYEGYKRWITPNPDIMCNSEIKFKVFLYEAMELGFDAVATGHYARIIPHPNPLPWGRGDELQASQISVAPFSSKGERIQDRGDIEREKINTLLKWVDTTKDQSYFLAGLSQEQLSRALFPIGHLQKSEVREIARQAWLPNALRKESQGICFVGKVDMKDFLQKKIPNSVGDIVDINEKILGKHKGVFYYTIGQRKGLWVWGMKEPIFVMKKDIKNNRLIVWYWEDEELYSDTLYIDELHFLSSEVELPKDCHAKIRYRQPDQACEIRDRSHETGLPGKYEIKFQNPQRAIASGQIIALYDGDELWGSGIII